MIEINVPLIATSVGLLLTILGTIWKFASSVIDFGHSVDELKEAVIESRKDRKELREIVNGHNAELKVVVSQYKDIKNDLDWVKHQLRK